MDLRSLVRRSIFASCAFYLLDDWRAGRRLHRGDVQTTSGARHADKPLAESIDYIRKVHRDYLRYGGVQSFAGVVAEIGPGDNFGLALLLLANGATEIHAIDRYYSQRDPQTQGQIYRTLAAEEGANTLFDGDPSEATMRGLHYHPGVAAEEYFSAGRPGRPCFDAIISRAVLEHLYDPIGALSDMAHALRPGGRLIHRIDFRDHGMFSDHHPLTFLTIPDALYHRMTRQSGRPNRVLVDVYQRWLDQSGLSGNILITRLSGIQGDFDPAAWPDLDQNMCEQSLEAARQIRPKLAKRFQSMSDEDLAVAGITLVAEKPVS
jgi:SAM-dependent methyltransferase